MSKSLKLRHNFHPCIPVIIRGSVREIYLYFKVVASLTAEPFVYICCVVRLIQCPVKYIKLKMWPSDAEPVFFWFNRDVRAKFEVGQLMSCSHVSFLLLILYTGVIVTVIISVLLIESPVYRN